MTGERLPAKKKGGLIIEKILGVIKDFGDEFLYLFCLTKL